MKIAKIISFLGVVAMSAAIGYAFAVGDFGGEGSQLLAMPWGIVSLVDLYVGFSLFALWIFYRESNKLTATAWIVLLMVLGFFTGSLYVLLALFRSEGDWDRFWHGRST
ncbi:DUF1475 family protein [Candidatus Leptofilum sp.]|uniref:DUF1475 family protein n=1 Tax=Candidatus Leptofilum sp. TaxID=3241576 RepID=UPI003B5B920A